MSDAVSRETMELARLYLALEKMRQEIRESVSREHDWAAQERHWKWQKWTAIVAVILMPFVLHYLGNGG